MMHGAAMMIWTMTMETTGMMEMTEMTGTMMTIMTDQR